MTTDLITLRRDILAGAERTHASLMASENDSLPGITEMRARSAAGVEYSRRQFDAAINGAIEDAAGDGE